MTRWMLVSLSVLGLCTQVEAQTQIKPYFMVIFDDSGSMGNSTGSGNNTCGQPRTRINDAKCALQRVLGAFGDVVFGLTSFKTYGTGTTIHVPIQDDNQNQILSWVDFTGSPELVEGGSTPIRDALDNVRAYYQSASGPVRGDPARGCRPYYVILLHDGRPCCNTRNNLANSVAAATRLLDTPIPGGPNERIETFVIYFGTSMSDLNQANQIAAGGGTGAAHQATNEEELALAFSTIINDSLLTEVCDDADNDCDGAIDEGFQKYCDRDGTFGPPTSDPRAYCTNPGDDCDLSDDNCFDGTADEPRNLCGECGPEPAEVCDGRDNNCNGLVDEGGICMGCVPTGAEVCDNSDNDCDGAIDEGLTRSCGSDVGVCRAGTETCSAGAWVGCTATGGGPEVCNNLDDDCDGRVDGLSRSCGTDVGACRAGTELCLSGSWGSCLGAIGPSTERCDGVDNDCDGSVDEADPDVGTPCGETQGECEAGTIQCVGGALSCVGAVGPTAEVCDGLDNDCDGLPDDGLGVGAPCGSDVGACQPGVTICRDGMTFCEGEIAPASESCNDLDDDCDGSIDEGLGLGEACGTDVGACMAGTLQCIDGRETCVGEVPAGTETCDCEDNDCDGSVDEEDTRALCPGESSCVDCQCALPCTRSEFGFTCPTGKAPRVEGDSCFCVADACDDAACGAQTLERDGEVLCSDDPSAPTCVCKNNECTFPCDGVACSEGTVCEPNSGTCVEDSCRALGCPEDQLCDFTTGECADDPCATTACPPDQACRRGTCIGSCADVECGAGQRCREGACVDDPCTDVRCGRGEVCDPADGSCTDDRCVGVRCPPRQVCAPLSGDCEPDPCLDVHCPDSQVCRDGECVGGSEADAGIDAGVDAGASDDERTRLLAAGGGGCACTVGGLGGGAGSTGGPLAFLLLVGLIALRRRRRLPKAVGRAAAVGLGAVFLLASAGCDVEPFCVDCEDAGADGGPADAGGVDAARRDAATTDAGTDTGGDAACAEGREEICNDLDDDCDGLVDEGIDTATDIENCGGCGVACAPPGAFGVCTGGVCGVDRCDVGFFDLDGDPANGCEYRCLPTADDDSNCDFRDNDCDGSVDEDFDFDMDVNNCGSCGRTCRFAHAGAACAAGACELGACEEGFHDIDGIEATGCEYACTPATPATETCNRRDDDCDGLVDEGNPGGGASCGTSTGECRAGTEACVAGAIVCMGSVGPNIESCNGLDDDCDGSTDENFLSNDVNNCGMCGNVCSFAGGFAECRSGSCTLVACEDGFWDADGDTSNGCEYRCDFNGSEACNGVDDDCDGRTDEGITPPSNFCLTSGVCAGTSPRCAGAGGWTCDYPATYEATETRCDGLDNDCNGAVDEPFLPLGLGTVCSNGTGSCRRTGSIVCAAGGTGVTCNAPPAGTPGTEVCDGEDNDCDGLVDEPKDTPGPNPSYVVEDMVRVTQGGSTFWMYTYEASRPDATAVASGASAARSCSRPDVMPWTQVTYPEARDACLAAGMRLCTEAEFQRACASSTGSCTWAYGSSCTTYQPNTCNGNDYDPVAGPPDDDLVLATRSLPMCYASHGGSSRIYDLSGNVKEWMQARSAGVNPLRGGSMNNPSNGLRCDFDFTVADDVFQLTNVGFRCCSDTAP